MRAPNFALALLAIAQLALAIARVQNDDPASYQLPNNVGRPGAMKAQRPRYNPHVRTDLNDDEKHWFGSIGSNSRTGAQSAVDQTYRWFAPETQTGSSSSTAKSTSASLLTVDARKGAQTDPGKASPSGTRPQQGVFRSTRTVRKPADSDPTPLRFPGSHSILKRQDELKMALSASKEQPSDPSAASPSAHFKRGESSGTVTSLTFAADPAAGDARQKRKASKRGLLDRKRSQTIGDIAQIAGYIIVGLALAAVLSVVLFSCSQPLWWPWYAAHTGLVKAYSQLGAKLQAKSECTNHGASRGIQIKMLTFIFSHSGPAIQRDP